jgi:hypothetical protein
MIKIELKEEELDLVLQALATQPYRSVATIIQNIVGQAQAAKQSAPKEEAK